MEDEQKGTCLDMGSRGGGKGCMYRHGLGGQKGTCLGVGSWVGGVEKVACVGMDFRGRGGGLQRREVINGSDLEEVPSKFVVTWHLADPSQKNPGLGLPLMVS